jgi:alkylation response protein AidB-like acyl-CoA dehydrogenase
MSMTFTDEQDEFRKSVRRFLEQKSWPADVRRLMETDEGYDRAVWQQMAEQLGLPGLALPEEYGGSGYGLIDQIAVLEEMDRALLCAPYFSSVVLGATALMQSGDDAAKRDLLPGIADGSSIATLGWVENPTEWGTGSLSTTAKRSGDGYTIDGTKTVALDGHTASLILVVTRAEGGPALFAVDASASGLARRKLETLDMTRKVAALGFAGTPARLIADEGAAVGILERTLRLAWVALAAEQVGAAQKCLDMSVAYAKLRVQFGRPIGSFQAIKHKCADMLLEVESARSAAYYAAWAAADGSDELPLLASLAKACALTRSQTRRRRTSRSTAASASPGSTTRTCTTGWRSRPSSSSAARLSIATCSRSGCVLAAPSEVELTEHVDSADLQYSAHGRRRRANDRLNVGRKPPAGTGDKPG